MEASGKNNIPRQKLPKSKKTKDWGKTIIDSFETYVTSDSFSGASGTSQNLQVNYDLYNGKLDPSDFEYVTNPYGMKQGEFPANLQHYDIVSPKINLLIGEEIKRPLNYRAITTNSDAISEIEKEKVEIIQKELVKVFEQAYNGGVPGESGPPMPPEELDKFLKYEYQDMREKTAHDLLKYLEEQQRLLFKFNDGMKDALLSGREIYWVGTVGGKPVVRVCNPLDITVVTDKDNPYIEDAQAVIEERWMALGSVIDEFNEDLTEKEICDIEEMTNHGSGKSPNNDLNYNVSEIRIQGDDAYRSANGGANVYDGEGNVRVIRVEWKSLKKIGFLQVFDPETEEWNEEIVDEDFDVPSEATKDRDKFYNWTDSLTDLPMRIKWDWVNEWWEGTKIGDDIYVNIQAKANQRRSIDNPAICKSGYVGYLYNARNSESISLIDRMKPYQYMYNILMYRTELAFAKSKGKLAVMDIAQIPRSEGWDVDSWLYYLESMGIMFINSAEEGKQGQTSTFNQFSSIDLSMGNYINQHVMMLNQIKTELEELAGVSRQRMGQISSSELVGNTERAVTQSSHITEYWFSNHDEVKRRVYEALIDVAKIAWRGTKKLQYVLGDMSRVFIDLEEGMFHDAEYGIFITNSSKDIKALETLRMSAQQAMQSGNMKISSFAQMMQTDSLAEITRELERSQEKTEQRQEQSAQADREAQTKAAEVMQQTEIEKQNREDRRAAEANATKVEVANIQAQAKLMDIDRNNNGVRDSIDREKYVTENNMKLQKMADEREKSNRELNLKERELELRKAESNKPNQ